VLPRAQERAAKYWQVLPAEVAGFRSINVRLREEFQFYANVRPAHTLIPGGRFDDIDLVFIQENLEGLCGCTRTLHSGR